MRIFKKKLSILLSLSLALLSLSLLGTTSYAKEITSNDINNFIVNYYKYYYGTNELSDFKSFLDSTISQENVNAWVERINRDNFYSSNRWLLTGINGYVCLWYVNGNDTQINQYPPYYSSGSIYVNTSYYTGFMRRVNIGTRQWDQYVQTGQQQVNSNFIYTDMQIWNRENGQYTTIKWGIGYENPTGVLTGTYTDDYFTFLLNSNLNTIIINGDSVPYIEHNTNQANTYVLGELGLAKNFYNAELFTYRWQQGSWKLQNIRTLDYIGPTTDNLIEVTIRGDWINPNTLYSLQMNPHPDSDFAPYSQPFFVKNRYTSITNGVLDLDNTFSGDYYNNYNNDTNTQDIINNTNDDSQVTAILGDFFNSGDSGDSMLSSLGFDFIKRIDNPFVATIRTIFLGLLNCFLDNNDVVLDLGHHGTHMYISSADFSNNGSGDVFILVKYALEGLWIFFFCKAGYTILTHATTADINALLNDVDVDGTWHNPMDRGDWRLM